MVAFILIYALLSSITNTSIEGERIRFTFGKKKALYMFFHHTEQPVVHSLYAIDVLNLIPPSNPPFNNGMKYPKTVFSILECLFHPRV